MSTLHAVAGYLPGLAPADLAWRTLRFEAGGRSLDLQVPQPDAAQLNALAQRVRQASRRHLKTMSVSQICALIDRAIARLLDPADPYRRQMDELLPIVTGYDEDMVRLGLTSLFKTFREPQLRRFIAEDFANPKMLDEFQPRPKGGAARAFGPDLLVHSWAGNVPALALWSLVCGLLVKAGNIGKLPSAEPLFAGLFARLLVELHPPLADCLAIVWWAGGDDVPASTLFGQADTVLAYGSNETLEQVRRLVPVTTRFLGHGHKLGFGMIGRAALDPRRAPALARLAAHDVARYDQQGCYSPHLFHVERGGQVSPLDFAHRLASELASLQHRFPRRALELEEAGTVAAWRQRQELRSASSDEVVLLGDAGSSWGVAYADAPQPLLPGAGQRHVTVSAVDSLDQVVDMVLEQTSVRTSAQGSVRASAQASMQAQARLPRGLLQTVGIATTPAELDRLAPLLGAAGVTRIAAIGAMCTPEAGWHHDGRFNLIDLVRMVEIEQSAETAAEGFAPYAL